VIVSSGSRKRWRERFDDAGVLHQTFVRAGWSAIRDGNVTTDLGVILFAKGADRSRVRGDLDYRHHLQHVHGPGGHPQAAELSGHHAFAQSGFVPQLMASLSETWEIPR